MKAGVDPRRAYAHTPKEAYWRLEGVAERAKKRFHDMVWAAWVGGFTARAKHPKRFRSEALKNLGLDQERSPEDTKLSDEQLEDLSG